MLLSKGVNLGGIMSAASKEEFEYPFSKSWFIGSVVLSILSILFAIFLLLDLEPVNFLSIYLHPLILYFVITSILTVLIFFLKLKLYSARERAASGIGAEYEGDGKAYKFGFIIVIVLVLLALFSPLFLSHLVDPLVSLLLFLSVIPAMNIPEIILYLLYRQKSG